MAEPSRLNLASGLRIAFGTGAALLLLACLAGILVSGPIVVRVPRFDPRVAPSEQRLRQAVTRLCEDFAPRDATHGENLDRAADWIAAELRAAGLEVEIQNYTVAEGRFRNVIGKSPGTDPAAGSLVIGAHYDAANGTPGADDNASGVAVLVELARTLPQPAARGSRYFVAFSTGEAPFFGTDGMGSARFAESLAARGESVDLMVALDTVGFYDDAPGSQSIPWAPLRLLYPDTGNFVAVTGDLRSGSAIKRVRWAMTATGKIDVFSFRAPAWILPVHLSDHLSFRDRGFPAVQVTDTALLRNPRHHGAGDLPGTLDYARMGRLVQALHGLLWDPEAPVTGTADREPH